MQGIRFGLDNMTTHDSHDSFVSFMKQEWIMTTRKIFTKFTKPSKYHQSNIKDRLSQFNMKTKLK